MSKTIYIAMAITGSPDEYRVDFQRDLKAGLRALPDVEVLDFIDPKEPEAVGASEQEIVDHDKQHLEECDLMIGVCDYPATGLGMEIVFRHNLKKPLLLFAHKDRKITHMVVGFAKREDIPCIKYKSVEDIVAEVEKSLATL